MRKDFPILEFDPNRKTILEPDYYAKSIDISDRCVLAIFHNDYQNLGIKSIKKISKITTEIGNHPIFQIERKNKKVAIFNPGVGAPLVAFLMEELIACGFKKFIACGSVGSLFPNIPKGSLIVPTSAVRDEGTSYHYLPPSRQVEANSKITLLIENVLKKKKERYIKGKIWTTDGVYRETVSRTNLRRDEGCLAVEMESAALFAVAKFRKVDFGQILYTDDTLCENEWICGFSRRRKKIVENKILNIAVDICLNL